MRSFSPGPGVFKGFGLPSFGTIEEIESLMKAIEQAEKERDFCL